MTIPLTCVESTRDVGMRYKRKKLFVRTLANCERSQDPFNVQCQGLTHLRLPYPSPRSTLIKALCFIGRISAFV